VLHRTAILPPGVRAGLPFLFVLACRDATPR